MKIFSRIYTSILTVLVLLTPLSAQTDVSITAQLTNPDIKMFMISDFNFTGKSTITSEVFQITILNNNPTQAQQCVLKLSIRSENEGELASGITNPFTLEPLESIIVTNRNLFTKVDERFTLEDYNIEESGSELVDKILATGKLPSDRYFFEFNLTFGVNINQMPLYDTQTQVSIDVTNPTIIDLILPGSTPEDLTSIYTTLPLFRWESNMDRFRLVVAEYLPDQHTGASPEQIINDRILLQVDLKLDTSPGAVPGTLTDENETIITSTNYQYPSAGVLPLQEGHTYYWQVIGTVITSGSPVELPSEIWAFQIKGGGDVILDPEIQQLLDELNITLSDMMEQLMGAEGELFGFSPTGAVLLNGSTLTVAQLKEILLKIRNGEYSIISSEVR